MSALRSLRITLGSIDVGSLYGMDDGRTYFLFDAEYAIFADRPVLSIAYEADAPAETQQALMNPTLKNNIGAGHGKLPAYFRNLLPEGLLRTHLIDEAGIPPDDELGLLAYCGTDLPGNVFALAEVLSEKQIARLVMQNRESYEQSSFQLPTPQAVSLSGVQPKISLMEAPDGRYVMRSKLSDDCHFIGKLPTSDYRGLPEVEHLSMQLAQLAGVNVCRTELLPLSAIDSKLPFSVREDARQFLLVYRYDRDQPTPNRRKHTEDFAQVLNLAPEDKYKGDYATLGVVLQEKSVRGDKDVHELLRRIKVNEMLGNYDAHVKNFSLLYDTPTQPALSPAYDIVAYAAYLSGRGHALRFFPDQQQRLNLTPGTLRQFANLLMVSERQLSNIVGDTVKAAVALWPKAIRKSELSREQKRNLLSHFKANESVAAFRKRWKAKTRRAG